MKSIVKFVAMVLSFVFGRSYYVGYLHEGDLVVEERRFGRVRYAWFNKVAGSFPASKVRWTEEALDWLAEESDYEVYLQELEEEEDRADEAWESFPHSQDWL